MAIAESVVALMVVVTSLAADVEAQIEEDRQARVAVGLETGTHEVGLGDTLGEISGWYGVSVARLASYNGISNPDLIIVGQRLTVSGFVEPTQASVAVTQQASPAPTREPTAPVPAPTSVPVQPAPQSPPVSPPVVSPSSGSGGDYRSIIARYFPEQVDKAYRVFMCESGGNPHNKANPTYRGAWQFDIPTWNSVGGSGDPANASMEEQTMRARMLYDSRGWQPWPHCGRL